MNIYPYVYRIDHPSGEFYIGYRCANKAPALDDFGIRYKTSSKYLSHPFEEYTQTILAEFFTDTAKTDAYDFEQALIFEHWGNTHLANKSCYHGKARMSTTGQKHSEETKQKMAEAKRGRTHSDETRAKMSESMRKKTASDEHRKKMSEARRGQKHSEETKAKMSEAQRRRWAMS